MTLLKRVFKYLTYKMVVVLYLKEGNLCLKDLHQFRNSENTRSLI